MKILLVADAVGGVFTHAIELARALTARGVRVVLATEGAPLTLDRRRAVAAIAGVVHEERAFRLEWMEDPWEDVEASGRWLLALEARARPDVVHTCEYAHGALPFRAPKLVAGHSCVLSWFEAVRGEPAPPSWDRYRAAVRAGLLGADAIVCPSAWMAAALVRHHGPIATPRVVPNGRDPSRFSPGPKEDLVLGAGRVWDEAKNAAALVRVAPRLPWPVFLAGDAAAPRGGPLTPALPPRGPPTRKAASPQDQISSPGGGEGDPLRGVNSLSPRAAGGEGQGEGGRVTFLGRLSEEDLARWLSRAAIFAHPARYEPFGLAVLEAALSGCALVLGDVPSLRDLWAGAAELVPPGDDAALAARVSALARDFRRRDALAARARARALELGPDRMASGYLAVYASLAGRHAAEGLRP